MKELLTSGVWIKLTLNQPSDHYPKWYQIKEVYGTSPTSVFLSFIDHPRYGEVVIPFERICAITDKLSEQQLLEMQLTAKLGEIVEYNAVIAIIDTLERNFDIKLKGEIDG